MQNTVVVTKKLVDSRVLVVVSLVRVSWEMMNILLDCCMEIVSMWTFNQSSKIRLFLEVGKPENPVMAGKQNRILVNFTPFCTIAISSQQLYICLFVCCPSSLFHQVLFGEIPVTLPIERQLRRNCATQLWIKLFSGILWPPRSWPSTATARVRAWERVSRAWVPPFTWRRPAKGAAKSFMKRTYLKVRTKYYYSLLNFFKIIFSLPIKKKTNKKTNSFPLLWVKTFTSSRFFRQTFEIRLFWECKHLWIMLFLWVEELSCFYCNIPCGEMTKQDRQMFENFATFFKCHNVPHSGRWPIIMLTALTPS